MARRKLHRYTGNEVASQPSIAEQLLRGTKIGNWLYGESKTYTDGNNAKRQDATFKESANGQMVQRMGETAKDAGSLALTGLAFGNPLTTSNAMAPLITGSQAYWIGYGINDGAQRIESIGEGVKNFVEDPSWQVAGEVAREVPMLALDVAGAVPVAKTVTTVAKQMAKPAPKPTIVVQENPGYINTVDDALPERQPLTINKSTQFWNRPGSNPTSFKEMNELVDVNGKMVPKWQLSRGQRTQPYVIGYRVLHPEDVVVNFEKEKNTILNLFNSKTYRDRLLADGYTPEQIDDFIQTRIPIKRLRTATAAQSNKVGIGDAGEAFGDYIWLNPKIGDAEVALHEFGHVSEWPGMWGSTIQPKITTIEPPYFDSRYFLSPGEVRTRALGVLQWMDETGGSIDDFYKATKFGTNRRASQFRFAYPEDQGRNYLLHFWQNGGKVNPKK